MVQGEFAGIDSVRYDAFRKFSRAIVGNDDLFTGA